MAHVLLVIAVNNNILMVCWILMNCKQLQWGLRCPQFRARKDDCGEGLFFHPLGPLPHWGVHRFTTGAPPSKAGSLNGQ